MSVDVVLGRARHIVVAVAVLVGVRVLVTVVGDVVRAVVLVDLVLAQYFLHNAMSAEWSADVPGRGLFPNLLTEMWRHQRGLGRVRPW